MFCQELCETCALLFHIYLFVNSNKAKQNNSGQLVGNCALVFVLDRRLVWNSVYVGISLLYILDETVDGGIDSASSDDWAV